MAKRSQAADHTCQTKQMASGGSGCPVTTVSEHCDHLSAGAVPCCAAAAAAGENRDISG